MADQHQQQTRRLGSIQQHLVRPDIDTVPAHLLESALASSSTSALHDQDFAFSSTNADSIPTTSSPAPQPKIRERKTAVIVAGARTPFVRAFGELLESDAIELGCAAVSGLLRKVESRLDPRHIDAIIFGNVVLSSSAPNLAREIVIDLNLPRSIRASTVSMACLSGLESIRRAVHEIECGEADCIIAGGADSMSNGEMPLPRHLTHALARWQYGKNKGTFAGVLEFLRAAGSPMSWFPRQPAIAERSTGRTMGFHADLMAQLNSIPRQSQDDLALRSHTNAARARQTGYLAEEIVPVRVRTSGKLVREDNLIRASQDRSKVANLSPVFRSAQAGGTVTAASSSPLTDGGSAVLIMSEEKARSLGLPTDVVVRSFSMTAIDPFPQLLMAPALAIPRALDSAGITLDDIDFVEMHEAFAAQVLSTLKALASPEFAHKYLNRELPIGPEIPLSKLNINGGSIAIGHPFAATGGRVVTSAINELRRSQKHFALISICAAGGLGGAVVLERRNNTNS